MTDQERVQQVQVSRARVVGTPTAHLRDLAFLFASWLAIHFLSEAAVLLAPAGSLIASWWPAAGLGVGLAAVVGPRRRRLVLLAVLLGTLSGSLFGGRPADLALAFAACSVAEAAVSARLLTRRGPARLAEMTDLVRLGVAVAAGSTLVGLLGGLTAVVLQSGDLLGTWAAATPSHAAAQLLVVPALLTLGTRTGHRRRAEALAQWALLAAATGVVFAVLALPLTFVPLPVMVWAAVRLGMRTVTSQLLLLVLATTVLSAAGYGPFAVGIGAVTDPRTSTLLLQVFGISYALVVLPLALAVRQREAAARRLAASEALFREGFTQSLLGQVLLRRSADGLQIVEANPVARRMMADAADDGPVSTPSSWCAQLAAPDRALLNEAVADLVAGRTSGWRREVASAATPRHWYDIALTQLRRPDGEVLLSAQLVDVTARREAEEALARLALHDGLTGLANRVLLVDRLDQALAATRRSGRPVALLFCDLDDFKTINDTHGHQAGDAVLKAVARRLTGTARAGDTVARIGGDEFVVLCPDAHDPEQAEAAAARIVQAGDRPVDVAGQPYLVRLSVGVVVGRPDSTAETLLRDADSAMYAAKAQGKGRAVVFAGSAGV